MWAATALWRSQCRSLPQTCCEQPYTELSSALTHHNRVSTVQHLRRVNRFTTGTSKSPVLTCLHLLAVLRQRTHICRCGGSTPATASAFAVCSKAAPQSHSSTHTYMPSLHAGPTLPHKPPSYAASRRARAHPLSTLRVHMLHAHAGSVRRACRPSFLNCLCQ